MLKSITINIEIDCGASISQAMQDAMTLSKQLNAVVSFMFNGIKVHVYPNSTYERNFSEYQRIRDYEINKRVEIWAAKLKAYVDALNIIPNLFCLFVDLGRAQRNFGLLEYLILIVCHKYIDKFKLCRNVVEKYHMNGIPTSKLVVLNWEFTPATWLREKWRQYKSKRVCGVDDNVDDLPF